MALLKGVKDRIDVKVTAEVMGDMGRKIKVPFVVTLKKPTQSEARAIGLAAKDETLDMESTIREWLYGWSGLQGPGGEDVPFSEEALQEMLDSIEYTAALTDGIAEVLRGGAKAKN